MEQTDLTNSNLMDVEDFSEISARKLSRKQKRIARLKAKGKTTKADRKAERLKRKLARQEKKGKNIPLTKDELEDEALDIEDAKMDGDTAEHTDMLKDAKVSGNPEVEIDTTTVDTSDDKILGMPKMVFYIGLGVIALVGGIIVYKKFIAKKP